MLFFDFETDAVFLTDLIRFLSEDLSLGAAGDDFRFCSVLRRTVRENRNPAHQTLATIACARSDRD